MGSRNLSDQARGEEAVSGQGAMGFQVFRIHPEASEAVRLFEEMRELP